MQKRYYPLTLVIYKSETGHHNSKTPCSVFYAFKLAHYFIKHHINLHQPHATDFQTSLSVTQIQQYSTFLCLAWVAGCLHALGHLFYLGSEVHHFCFKGAHQVDEEYLGGLVVPLKAHRGLLGSLGHLHMLCFLKQAMTIKVHTCGCSESVKLTV